MAYDNNNSGILSRNERKQQPSHPDFSGSCEVGGVQYWISGWVKDGKPGSKMDGKRFFSLAFKPKEQKPDPGAYNPPPATKPLPIDEDVPF